MHLQKYVNNFFLTINRTGETFFIKSIGYYFIHHNTPEYTEKKALANRARIRRYKELEKVVLLIHQITHFYVFLEKK